MMDANAIQVRIGELCHQFRLPTMGAQSVSRFTGAGHGDALETLLEVLEQEAEDRRQRRIGRLRTASRLPVGKTWETPVFTGAGSSSTTECPWLCGSNWASCLTAASWSEASTCWPSDCQAPARPMHCAPWATGWWKPDARSYSPRPTGWCRACPREDGGTAGRQARPALPRQLRKLDNYDFLLLDDLGYLPQGAEESEVLFTLIAERYERRSMGITSNLVFSQWEHIFANPMATAAAIDRVVHHSVILEFDVPSYRTGVAQQRGLEQEVNRQE